MGTSTNCSALRGRRHAERCGIRVQRDLGHGDNLLNKRGRVALLQEFHHLVSQLRHRHIEDLHVRQDVHNVRRGVPQNLRLWPHLNESCRPGGKHIPVVVHAEVHRAWRPEGEESSGPRRCSCRSPPPCSWPCSVSLGRRGLGQEHGDGWPFVTKELA